jgi:UDP-glucose:(heptosyl)LPS alpha-1,3-glucosyltransferase
MASLRAGRGIFRDPARGGKLAFSGGCHTMPGAPAHEVSLPEHPPDEMKLAVIRQECSYRKGGAERYAANLCKALAEMGHHVRVLAETFDSAIHPALVHVPIKVNHASSAARSRSFHRNSQKALVGLEVDAVLALSRSYPADAFRVSDPLHRYWMKVRYPGRLNHFLQRLNPRHRAILDLENHILDPANTRMIITNSRLSKTLIREYYDYPEDRIHVAYNGVDLERFQPAIKSDGALQLLFVGQDFKRKGLAAVIDALALVRAAGFTPALRVIGRDDDGPYRQRAENLGVGGQVRFEGPTSEIQTAYQSADLFVFPTLYDPFANVCLEALACGLPVLTTTTNGASEVVTENEDGYVVDGDAAGLAGRLAAAITTFCQLPDSRRGIMRENARAKAERFTIRANAEAVVGLLIS